MRALHIALSACLAALLLLFAWHDQGRAALNAAVGTRTPVLELLVFEHPDCTYCQIFRRDVLPKYRHAVPGDAVPLRFVDIAETDTRSLALQSRIDMVPTAVLMKDGNEIGRISGYWGPTNFFKLLSHMLARLE
jgi:thioredoxin-related protein